jgi:hypothetical protein
MRPKGLTPNSDLKLVLLVAGIVLLIGTVSTQAESFTVFDMQDFATQEMNSVQFNIDVHSHLNVSIIGARNRDQDHLYAYGWIIDSKSREVVWSMNDANTRRVQGEKSLRKFEGKIDLDVGSYEAFYYAGSPFAGLGKFDYEKDVEDFGGVVDFFGNVLHDKFGTDAEYYSKLKKKYRFTLTSNTDHFKVKTNLNNNLPNQVLSIVKPRNLNDMKIGFTVDKDLSLIVYSFGEYSENGDVFMDGAKIINANTRERVWAMERWNTDWGGGALKNRCFHDDIKLSKGQYILHYWTDDSHTYDDWSGSPPYDPNFWGVTLAAESAEDMAFVKQSDIEKRKKILVQIVKVGDNANLERSFDLKEDIKFNVYAIGEGKRDYMYDFAWIEKLENGEIVWKMIESETDHAGGASKNRVYDGIIELTKGKYTLHYKSDGSHSYRSWNEAQPSDPRHYGVTLFAYDPDFDPDIIEVGELKTGQYKVKYLKDGEHVIPSVKAPRYEKQNLIVIQNKMKKELMALRSDHQKMLQELILDMEMSFAEPEEIEDLKEQIDDLNEEYLNEIQVLVVELDEVGEDWSEMKDIQDQIPELEHDYLTEIQDIRQKVARCSFKETTAPSMTASGFLVKMNGLGDNTCLKTIFKVDKPTKVRIYALGEGLNGQMYDFGWLISKKTGEVIWEMAFKKTDHAGGAYKNRIVDDIIMLDKGEYEAYFVTDNSHSYEEWNSTKPKDERGWGMTIKLVD